MYNEFPRGGFMQTQPPNQVTQLLQDWGRGNQKALDDLIPLVYEELRKLARGYLRAERPDHTLQPTALLHELYLRLVEQSMPDWESRSQFFGVAARLMRQILVDHARTRSASRRGGPNPSRILLDQAPIFSQDQAEELLAFDDALQKLEHVDKRKARIIEMRSFGGMTVEEAANALGISGPTVKREMRLARAWLRRELRL